MIIKVNMDDFFNAQFIFDCKIRQTMSYLVLFIIGWQNPKRNEGILYLGWKLGKVLWWYDTSYMMYAVHVAQC